MADKGSARDAICHQKPIRRTDPIVDCSGRHKGGRPGGHAQVKKAKKLAVEKLRSCLQKT